MAEKVQCDATSGWYVPHSSDLSIHNTQVVQSSYHICTYVCMSVCTYRMYVCVVMHACVCIYTLQQMDLYTVQYIYMCVCMHYLSPVYILSVYLSSYSCPSSNCLPSSSQLPPIFLLHLSPICPLSHTYLPPAQCHGPSSRQHVSILSKLPSCWCSAGAVSVRSTWSQRWVSSQAVQEALLAS